jgi:hypothetical protein
MSTSTVKNLRLDVFIFEDKFILQLLYNYEKIASSQLLQRVIKYTYLKSSLIKMCQIIEFMGVFFCFYDFVSYKNEIFEIESNF